MKVLKSTSIYLPIELTLIFIALTILKSTDSYYAVYLLLGILGSISAYQHKGRFKLKSLATLFSCFFALCITLSNYQIFTTIASPGGIYHLLAFLSASLVFTGNFIIFQNLLKSAKNITIKTLPSKLTNNSRIKFFFTCFAIFAVIDLAILFFCFYPGVLTPDSIDEIGQMSTGIYSNHHPFYFTILIKFFVSIGIDLFHNINIGVALFSIFQIFTLSAAFSYALLTLYDKGVSRKLLLTIAIIIALLPFNIMYSFTMWKDVLFGAFFLIFTVAFYRYFHFPKHRKLTTSLIIISTIVICLFRSNAFIAILASLVIFFLLFKKTQLKLGLTLASAILIAFVLKTPVLNTLGVTGPDNVESLAIPMQQVARVLVEQKSSLSSDDLDLISNLANPDTLIDAYNPIIHDPIKAVVRLEGNKQFLSDHKLEFIGLYLRLGFRYPGIYLKAWIDQTRGYWNSGYSYWKWSDEVFANDYGITRTVHSEFLGNCFHIYLNIFEQSGFLTPLISIGLAVWLLFIIFYLSIISKNHVLTFLTIPFIMTWGTLLIATPVFAEFRYIYFLFTCLPFLIAITLIKKESSHEKR